MIEIEDIRRLDVRQGDVLVMRLNRVISDETRLRICEFVEPIITPLGAKVIILDGGITLDVLGKAPE
ncbi:MAG: hypothetical protein Q7T25_14115 [Sideroxyarcus sp.]|nr:hypothetical protein [Sideroxyarcus sp.]